MANKCRPKAFKMACRHEEVNKKRTQRDLILQLRLSNFIRSNDDEGDKQVTRIHIITVAGCLLSEHLDSERSLKNSHS